MGITVDTPAGVRQIGPYRIIGPHAAASADLNMLVIDSNVLIDIRDLYFKGPARVPAELQDLLLTFPNSGRNAVDINFGWASSELTWKRGRGTDLSARREFIHAARHVVDWNAEQVRRAFMNRHPPVNRDNRWPRVALDDPHEIGDPRIMIVPHYGCLLFLMQLYRDRHRWKARPPLAALQEYVRWTDDVLGIRDSYTRGLAISLLVGDSEAKKEVLRVFKLSGTEDNDTLAQKSWNVAWDIAMVSLAEGISYGLLPVRRPESAALVTRDLDPLLLRIGAEMRALIDMGHTKVPMTMVSMRPHARIDERELLGILEQDPLDSIARFGRDPSAMIRQAADAVRSLESDMGLAQRTADNWPVEDR